MVAPFVLKGKMENIPVFHDIFCVKNGTIITFAFFVANYFMNAALLQAADPLFPEKTVVRDPYQSGEITADSKDKIKPITDSNRSPFRTGVSSLVSFNHRKITGGYKVDTFTEKSGLCGRESNEPLSGHSGCFTRLMLDLYIIGKNIYPLPEISGKSRGLYYKAGFPFANHYSGLLLSNRNYRGSYPPDPAVVPLTFEIGLFKEQSFGQRSGLFIQYNHYGTTGSFAAWPPVNSSYTSVVLPSVSPGWDGLLTSVQISGLFKRWFYSLSAGGVYTSIERGVNPNDLDRAGSRWYRFRPAANEKYMFLTSQSRIVTGVIALLINSLVTTNGLYYLMFSLRSTPLFIESEIYRSSRINYFSSYAYHHKVYWRLIMGADNFFFSSRFTETERRFFLLAGGRGGYYCFADRENILHGLFFRGQKQKVTPLGAIYFDYRDKRYFSFSGGFGKRERWFFGYLYAQNNQGADYPIDPVFIPLQIFSTVVFQGQIISDDISYKGFETWVKAEQLQVAFLWYYHTDRDGAFIQNGVFTLNWRKRF